MTEGGRWGGKKILIIAGPNGAGKTTFAEELLPRDPDCRLFINADLISAGLSPFDPERVAFKAGRLMLEEIRDNIRRGHSFALETTLSGKGYARSIPYWQARGYRVKLFFLGLASPDLAVARVRQRVASGGHGIPEKVIRRRFHAGERNFRDVYRPIVDAWAVYDNSGRIPVLVEEGASDGY